MFSIEVFSRPSLPKLETDGCYLNGFVFITVGSNSCISLAQFSVWEIMPLFTSASRLFRFSSSLNLCLSSTANCCLNGVCPWALIYFTMFKSAIQGSPKEKLTFLPNPGKSPAGQHFLWLRQEDEKHSVVLFLTYAEPPGPFHRSHGKLLLKQTPPQSDARHSFSLTCCQTLCCE